jgi:tetratricopeptide (TPR) repeat protein
MQAVIQWLDRLEDTCGPVCAWVAALALVAATLPAVLLWRLLREGGRRKLGALLRWLWVGWQAPRPVQGAFRRGLGAIRRRAYAEALCHLTEVLRLRPADSAAWYAYGFVCSKVGAFRQAVETLERAVRLAPSHADAHNHLAWVLASCPEAAVRDGRKAAAHAWHGCELTRWRDPGKLDTLAVAFAEWGDFPLAVHWARKALGHAAPLAPADVAQVEEHLRLFEQGLPYRQKPAWPAPRRPEGGRTYLPAPVPSL